MSKVACAERGMAEEGPVGVLFMTLIDLALIFGSRKGGDVAQ